MNKFSADQRELLDDLISELDVPPSKYEEAKERYEAVGSFLNEPETALAKYNPDIYPQGSFALGTAVKPIGKDEYDVDAVCVLQVRPNDTTQPKLKKLVGDRLKESKTYKRMLDPFEGGRRCWTLKYAESSRFHLDVLPSVPDETDWLVANGVPRKYAAHALCITDAETWGNDDYWPKSNPRGYAEWFKDRMREILEERRKAVASAKMAAVEEVPDYEVRTPLQRVVQLLKRHRDLRYTGDPDKPISIIITTLAAKCYEAEPGTLEALVSVVPKLRLQIERRADGYWIPNPVNPEENFADKWNENRRKAEVFFAWLERLEADYVSISGASNATLLTPVLGEAFGHKDAKAAMAKFAARRPPKHTSFASKVAGRVISFANAARALFRVSHREVPQWRETNEITVLVVCEDQYTGERVEPDGSPLDKSLSLVFRQISSKPPGAQVWWQVVNTGREAEDADKLRGKLFEGGDTMLDFTAFRGSHFVACYIVKNGVCIGRSNEFVVNIK